LFITTCIEKYCTGLLKWGPQLYIRSRTSSKRKYLRVDEKGLLISSVCVSENSVVGLQWKHLRFSSTETKNKVQVFIKANLSWTRKKSNSSDAKIFRL